MNARFDTAVWSGIERHLAEVETFIPDAPPWTQAADSVATGRVRPGTAFGRDGARPISRRRQLALVLTVAAALLALIVAALLVGAPREFVDRRDEPFGPWGIHRSSDTGGSAVVLPDGRVLIASGSWSQMGTQVDPTVDVWDAVRGRVSAGAPDVGRVMATATLLLDGRVLVAGGFGGPYAYGPGSTAADVWDPATRTFGPTGPMAEPHVNHTATLLPDGRVVIIGGGSAEIWDPATGQFGPAGSLVVPPGVHTATLLPDGNVLVLGGGDPAIWRSTSRAFTPAATVLAPAGATTLTATGLLDGPVLVIRDGMAFTTRDGQATTPVGSLIRPRMRYATTLLLDGRALITGGVESEQGPAMTSVEVFDPTDGLFREAPPLAQPVDNHMALLLPDGRVLIVFDVNGPEGQAEPFIYDPGAAGTTE